MCPIGAFCPNTGTIAPILCPSGVYGNISGMYSVLSSFDLVRYSSRNVGDSFSPRSIMQVCPVGIVLALAPRAFCVQRIRRHR